MSASIVFTDDAPLVRFLDPPEGWTFAGEVLASPARRPQGKDGRFPTRSATEISLLCGATLRAVDAMRIAIHAFGPERQYIGCVVLAAE